MVALSLGLIFGPILGGYLIKLTGDIASAMAISIIIHGVLTIYAIILPESLPKFARNAKDSDPINNSPKAEEASILIRIKNGVLAILDPLMLFLPGRIDSSSDVNVTPSNYTLVTLVTAYGLIQFASTGISIVFIPYTNLAFHWTALEDNLYYSVQGAASFVVYIVIFPGLQKLYKRFIEKSNPRTTTPPSFSDLDFETNDESLHPTKLTDAEIRQKTVWNDLSFFIFGSFAYLIGYLIVPFFGTVPSLFISCFVRSLASVCLPSFYSLITSFVPIHQMGKALGGICVIDTIIMSMSSLLYGWVFAQTSSTIPSAFFFVSSAFSLLTILFGFSIWKAFKRVDAKKS
ncbi:hypothetical protein BGZ49_004157 [Haplosporangium sp. Z 27]|nr:hypothetical protein BGZ49_004157 [Haplosporangium sp. Z 27]